MSEPLPPGWKWTTVGEIFEIIGGSTPQTDNPDYWDGDIPWLTPDDLSRHKGVFISEGRRSITASGFKSASTQMLPENSVLFSSRAPIGYTAIAANPLCTNQGFKSLIVPIGVLSEYVYWYLQHATPAIQEMGSGTTFKEISKKRMAVVPFLLPPTNEQERIVDAIEEQFSRIDAAESAAQTALAKLDTLRRTVLTAAFSGRLVKPLNPRRAPDGLPEDWQCLSVGDVSDVQLGRQRSPNNHYGPHMHPYLRAANITWNGIDLNDVKEMNFDPSEANNFELCVGDILLNEASGSPNEVGKPAIWRGEIEPCYFQNTLLRVRTRGPLIHYLYWHFHFLARLGKFGEAGRGVNIRHLGKQGLINFPIIIAPLHEQKRIVAAIEEHFSRIDAAKSSLERCLQRCSTLRRAVLAAAFSGRLVEQDPNDEPASVLLERIAVEQPKRRTPRKSA